MSSRTQLWNRALETIRPSDPDAVTLAELCAMTQLTPETMYRRVMALIKQGRARRTVKRMKFNGVWRTVPAYVLVAPIATTEKKAKAA